MHIIDVMSIMQSRAIMQAKSWIVMHIMQHLHYYANYEHTLYYYAMICIMIIIILMMHIMSIMQLKPGLVRGTSQGLRA